MKRDTYLSIDMDFWCKYTGFAKVTEFFNTLDKVKIKPVVVKYHHELTKYINEMPNISRLINMDYHSDIADLVDCDKESFNEGTWVNYVRMQENAEYVWRYPLNTCLGYLTGYCHGNARYNPFNKTEQGKYHWNRVLKVHGPIEAWELNRIAGIGICMSPNWTNTKHEYFCNLLMAKGYITKEEHQELMSRKNESLKRHEEKEFSKLNKNCYIKKKESV